MNRHFLNSRLWLMTSLFAFLAMGLSAQDRARETALRFLQENPSKFELTQNDVSDVKIVREYRTKHNGVTHVWAQQQHRGIPVLNGLFGLHVKPDGDVVHLGHRFVNDLSRRINTELPSISAAKALEMAMADLGFNGFPAPSLRSKTNEQNLLFERGAISKKEIPVSASYVLTNSTFVANGHRSGQHSRPLDHYRGCANGVDFQQIESHFLLPVWPWSSWWGCLHRRGKSKQWATTLLRSCPPPPAKTWRAGRPGRRESYGG